MHTQKQKEEKKSPAEFPLILCLFSEIYIKKGESWPLLESLPLRNLCPKLKSNLSAPANRNLNRERYQR